MFIFLMVLYFIANAASKLLIRVLARDTRLDPYSSSLAIMVPTYIIGAIYGLVVLEDSVWLGVTPTLILLMLVFGVVQTFSGKVSMICQKHIETSSYSVIRMLFVPVSVVLSAIIFNETLSFKQLVGMLTILTGVSIVSTGGKLPRLKHVGKYELLTLLNSVFLGVYVIFSNYLIDQTSLATFLIAFMAIEQVPLIIKVAIRPKTMPSKMDYKLSAGVGLASAVHIVTFWLAIELVDNVALVSSLSAFRIVAIFIGGYIILKEVTNTKQKVAGSVLATAGLLLS